MADLTPGPSTSRPREEIREGGRGARCAPEIVPRPPAQCHVRREEHLVVDGVSYDAAAVRVAIWRCNFPTMNRAFSFMEHLAEFVSEKTTSPPAAASSISLSATHCTPVVSVSHPRARPRRPICIMQREREGRRERRTVESRHSITPLPTLCRDLLTHRA